MSILERVREFLEPSAPLARDASGEYPDMDVWVGTVLLFLELAYGDSEYVRKERDTIRRNIQKEFGILRPDAVEIMQVAENARAKGRDLRDISKRLRETYDDEQRKRIIALLWKVVNADGVVAEFEEVFVGNVVRMMDLSEEDAREARRRSEAGEV